MEIQINSSASLHTNSPTQLLRALGYSATIEKMMTYTFPTPSMCMIWEMLQDVVVFAI